jgi:hypothetical protein
VRTAVSTLCLAAGIAIGLLLTLHRIPTPLLDWQTWSLQDVAARAMLGGTVPPSLMSVRLKPIVQAAGVVTLAALIVGFARAVRQAPAGGWLLLLLGAMNLLLINVLWFYNDRYYVIFLPTLAYFAARLPATRAANVTSVALVALWLFVSVTGVRDMLATNGAVARLARALESEGVPPWEIDAGYPLNGWRLYVHPEHLPAGADPRYEVPYVTANPATLYRIVSGPEPGYDIVRTEQLPWVTWQVTDRLYVVRRNSRDRGSGIGDRGSGIGRPAK